MNPETEELLKRLQELYDRCEKTATVACTAFLTPAEQYAAEQAAKRSGWDSLYLYGGNPASERKIAFFLPYYETPETFDPSPYLCAVAAVTKFAQPGHRDYLGSLLALGIRRDCLGDIYTDGERAWFYCVPTVAGLIVASLDRVGRSGVKCEPAKLDAVPVPEKKVKTVTFTVQSQRLDAVAAGMFGVSRAAMAQLIAQGALTLNYQECTRPDVPVAAGDVVSVRGYGKGTFLGGGGVSRKGRTFVSAEILQ